MSSHDHTGSLDFLCISTTGWDEIWGSRQQIMVELVRNGHRVLFVERQISLEHILKYPDFHFPGMTDPRDRALREVYPNLWIWQPPLVLPGRYFSHSLNRVGQSRLVASIIPLLHQLDFQSPILWLYPPQSEPLIGKFDERLSVYHCIERFSGDQKGIKRKVMEQQENSLLSNVDQVFVHSQGLQALYHDLSQNPIIYIPSAADVQHFQLEVAIHPLMAAIPEPRLVLMGTLDTRIDFKLLEYSMEKRADWNLVLIGRSKQTSKKIASLLSLPNVYHFGYQPFNALPSLLKGANAGLIPYRITEMNRYINPIKAFEYLAAGIPVISTWLPELQPLSKWVTIIPPVETDYEDYCQNFNSGIEETLLSESLQKRLERQQFARLNTWNKRVSEMMEIVCSKI